MDDEATIRDVLELRLQKWGFEVIVCAEAREASEIVRRDDPDLVISDVVMPGSSGLDLLRALKGTDPDRPVILLTAHATVEMAVEAMKEGALDFLTKPLNYGNLKAVLDQAFRDRELLERSWETGAPSPEEHGFGRERSIQLFCLHI